MEKLEDFLPEIIFGLDRSAKFLFINEYFKESLGYEKQEIFNSHLSSIVTKDALPGFLYKLQTLLTTGKPVEFESEFMEKAGRAFPVNVKLSTFSDMKNKITVIGSANDISNQKEILKGLSESEKKWRGFVENLRQGVMAYDENGIITFANDPLAEMLGLDNCTEVIGRSIYSFIPEEGHVKLKKDVSHSMEEKNGFTFEIYLEIEGHIKFLLLNGRKISDGPERGFFSTVQDITSHKEILEDLSGRNRRLASINDLSAIVGSSLELDEILAGSLKYITQIGEMKFASVYIKDSIEGNISKKVEFFLPLEGQAKIKNANWGEMGSQVDDVSLAKRVLVTGHTVIAPHARKDSRIKLSPDSIIKSLVAVPLKSKEEVLGALIMASDEYRKISKEKEEILKSIGYWMGMAVENSLLYEKLKFQAERLEKANSYKDLFADIIRHDIITPAALVLSFSDLLLDDPKDPNKDDILKRIKKNARRIINLAEDSATFSKLENVGDLKKEQIELDMLLMDVLDSLEHDLERNRIQVIHYPSNIQIYAHKIIKEAFINIISNSIKYSPKDTEIGIVSLDIGDYVRVAISDMGEGVEDGAKESIFNRFERKNKEFVKGHGIGLAIVKRIVELHNGRVWVEDNFIEMKKGKSNGKKQKKGSIFFIEIPKN